MVARQSVRQRYQPIALSIVCDTREDRERDVNGGDTDQLADFCHLVMRAFVRAFRPLIVWLTPTITARYKSVTMLLAFFLFVVASTRHPPLVV